MDARTSMNTEATERICAVCGTRYDAQATFCQRDGTRLADGDVDPYLGRMLLDQFRIDAVLGMGGMGTVYRAHQPVLGRDVAIKILRRELVQSPDAVRRFQREVRVATSLDHPNLVRVFLFGQLPDGSLYLVMEYLDGKPLTAALEVGPFPVPRALHVVHQLCMGLANAHARGIIHRDIKPENILLVPDDGDPDFVKILDFGIARLLWGEQSNLTQAGVIFGTARYISPEGATGDATDTRSDVYAIGVLAYQLLCGETPFDASSPVALLMKHAQTRAPDLRSRAHGGHVPKPLSDIVMRCLAKRPDQRPYDAGQLAILLRNAAAELGIALPRCTEPLVAPSSGVFQTSNPAPTASTPAAPIADDPLGRTSLFGSDAPTERKSARFDPTPLRVSLDVAPPSNVVSSAALASSTRDATGELVVPGLRRARRGRTVVTIAVAFLVGAIGFSVVAYVQRPTHAGPAVAELERRLHEALAEGRLDGPGEDDVASLSAALLARDPHHALARSARAQVVEQLRTEAVTALAREDRLAARRALERALAIAPEDESLRDEIAGLEAPAARHPAAPEGRLAFEPARPATRAPITVAITLGMEVPEVDVEVRRAGRRVTQLEARPLGEGGRWVATLTLDRAGRYDVIVRAGALSLSETLDVRSAGRGGGGNGWITTQASSGYASPPPPPTAQTPAPAQAPAPAAPPTPPPPWSGGE